MKKKILIVYPSYGSGHKTTAEYIYNYFSKFKDYEVKIIDLIDYGNGIAKTIRKYNNKGNIITSGPIFSFIYELFDNKITILPYKQVVKLLFKKSLTQEILNFKPDILISTHPFGGSIMGRINKKSKTSTKIITIITDYASHAVWLTNNKLEDAFVVSHENVKKELIKYGIKEAKIYPFGIPLSNEFKNLKRNIDLVKTKYKINNKKPIFVFFGGGSNGSMHSYKYLKQLGKENLDINIIFVAGNNQKLKNKCENFINSENIKNINVLGFTKDIPNLLNLADVVITKPGGLSITEALEVKTPMILIPGNGGQENHNANFITKNKFGIRVYNPNQLVKSIKELIENKKLITEMKNNLKKYEENMSVEKLFNLVKEMDVNK